MQNHITKCFAGGIFFSKQKLLSSTKHEVACNTLLALKIMDYDLNKLDTETKGIYAIFK